jgi:hypothetical protein
MDMLDLGEEYYFSMQETNKGLENACRENMEQDFRDVEIITLTMTILHA